MILWVWTISAVLPIVFGSPVRFGGEIRDLDKVLGSIEKDSEQDINKKGQIWAVLVAGSYQFYNYRHQADICHAYQIFRAHGVPDKNIIVMMYDDIASDPSNPNPGVIINRPNGTNVYQNVPKDYTGNDVTSKNFLNVITGNGAALEGIGSGKVLNSGPNDHVFINFVDRGGQGEVAFPNDRLYADDFIKALKKMHKNKLFFQLLIYLESSYAGSMFAGLLPSDLNIFAVTASGANEESYATYWDETLEVYLGDLFSVSWMEDIDSEEHHKNYTTETLSQQYNNVVNRTSGFSTPAMYGTASIAKKHVKEFFGKDKKKESHLTNKRIPTTQTSQFKKEVVKSQDVLLHTLKKRIEKREDSEEKKKLQNQLEALLKGRHEIENLFERIISHLPVDAEAIRNKRESLTIKLFPCYKELVDTFDRKCVNINKNTFSFRHLYKFVNICATESLAEDQVLNAFEAECTSPSSFNNIH